MIKSSRDDTGKKASENKTDVCDIDTYTNAGK